MIAKRLPAKVRVLQNVPQQQMVADDLTNIVMHRDIPITQGFIYYITIEICCILKRKWVINSEHLGLHTLFLYESSGASLNSFVL